ncbi:MAG: winged helix-turn-helix domain-containing protein [archaeon]
MTENELKDTVDIPMFVFTSPYTTIVEYLLEDKRAREIAILCKISEQNLNSKIKRLEEAKLIFRGVKSSYREWVISSEVAQQLKDKIHEFKERLPGKFVTLNCHHISVVCPITQDNGCNLKHNKEYWRSKVSEETVEYDSLYFKVEKTTKNLIVRFPRDMAINYVGFGKVAIQSVKATAIALGNAVKNKALLRFQENLILGKPALHAHWAKKDKVAWKITKLGITYTVSRGKIWMGMDKSHHFSPHGEIETNDEEVAEKMLEGYLPPPH